MSKKDKDDDKPSAAVAKEKEAVQCLEDCCNEAVSLAEASPGDKHKSLTVGASGFSIYDFLMNALEKAAAIAKLPFVRDSIPQLRILVEAMSPSFFKWSLLMILSALERAIPETEGQADLSLDALKRAM